MFFMLLDATKLKIAGPKIYYDILWKIIMISGESNLQDTGLKFFVGFGGHDLRSSQCWAFLYF